MMYQLDIVVPVFSKLAEQAEQRVDDGAERAVDREEEGGEQAGHDHHHQSRHRGFALGRPDDLGALDLDLVHEFAGIDSRHVASSHSVSRAWNRCPVPLNWCRSSTLSDCAAM